MVVAGKVGVTACRRGSKAFFPCRDPPFRKPQSAWAGASAAVTQSGQQRGGQGREQILPLRHQELKWPRGSKQGKEGNWASGEEKRGTEAAGNPSSLGSYSECHQRETRQ